MQVTYISWGLAIAIGFAVIAVFVPEGIGASVMLVGLSLALLPLLRQHSSDPALVTKIFFVALGLRLLFGLIIYANGWFDFFGGDALTYDYRGSIVLDSWLGLIPSSSPLVQAYTATTGPGWGMYYLVAGIYYVFGRNFLAAQTFAAVFGAATAPLVYICAERVFENRRVGKYAAIGVAIFPAFVIWSAQLLKDGLIIFLLVLAMTTVLKLQEKFSYGALVLLIASLGGIISLRFYIFYMVAIAVAGTFVMGLSNSPAALLRRGAALVILGVGLTYLGVLQSASLDFERFGNLEQLQNSRLDLARSADSGFAEDIDVSTASGALTAIPIGFAYLIFAPFPWQVGSFRQTITLPEVFVWWAMIPLLVWGVVYTVKHRLRKALPILLFSGLLTLAYSMFQGNVGTAYRQRTQIQVFFFMFIAVGWVLLKERREDRKLLLETRRRQRDSLIRPDVQGYR